MPNCPVRNCVRVEGHQGVHTAAPSARTLDWDLDKTKARQAVETLQALDFATPPWADLND